MKCVNIKLWDLLGCFHYILNAPRSIKNQERKPLLFSLIEKAIVVYLLVYAQFSGLIVL